MDGISSPPKRMTRARAAARGTSTGATAASAAKAAANKATTTNTTTTTVRSTKRKTRADDADEDELAPSETHKTITTKATKTRGRPKKAAEPQSETEHEDDEPASAAPKPTRGRPRKAATAAASSTEPVKATRTRTKKTTTSTDENNAEPEAEPVKKATRTRKATTKAPAGTITNTFETNPTPGLKSACSRPASRMGHASKKSVSFQTPEKENAVLPPAKKAATTKAAAAKATAGETGMRAKPVRKPAGAARATRATRSAAATEEKKPLSPKKDGVNRHMTRDTDSDDELALDEKTALKPMKRSPVKPPAPIRKPEPQVSDDEIELETEDAPASSIFGSPVRKAASSQYKDSMRSPAKRGEGIPSLSFGSTQAPTQPSQSPQKSSILQSPAKRPQMPIKSLQVHPGGERSDAPHSPPKMSLLHSPAKRPTSPFKMPASESRPMPDASDDVFSSLPPTPVKEYEDAESEVEEAHEEVESTKEPEPVHQAEEVAAPEENAPAEDQQEQDQLEQAIAESDNIQLESPTEPVFPGRLSAVLPRHADPALKDRSASPIKSAAPRVPQDDNLQQQPSPEETYDQPAQDSPDTDMMDVDQVEENVEPESVSEPTPAVAVAKAPRNSLFGLRPKELDDQYMSESEDELTVSIKELQSQDDATLSMTVPATPTPAGARTPGGSMSSSAAKAASRAIRSVSKNSKLGFTPLAAQLGGWKASSPLKLGNPDRGQPQAATPEDLSLIEDDDTSGIGISPSKGTYFDDEMQIRADMEMEAALEAALDADIAAAYDVDEPEFDDVPVTNEDMELAAEANEMSLLDTTQAEGAPEAKAQDDATSETSQEYGDENAMPIDPALFAGANNAPVTPVKQPMQRMFNTTSKVPLKAADDSPPQSIKKRSASVARVPASRPTSGLSRNATVISYSPSKHASQAEEWEQDNEAPTAPVTPAKNNDIWSSMGTPARTPRRDLNPGLLRGAVVFVDVHTQEGADASAVFVDLLSQMGARCVKSWPWNPNSDANSEAAMSKIGITHVVYKDGGKRTLEKVRESNGVVQCVGVSWVLDCERENEWLEEGPYYIDTSLIPRGGKNRRKSMEPKALANMNGTLVTPMKNNASAPRECQTVPHNNVSRRESTLWMRTPSDCDEDEDETRDHFQDKWDNTMLTPVPKTPAPESIAKFAMDVTPLPETPSGPSGGFDYGDFDSSPEKEPLAMQTCPPKQRAEPNMFANMGAGIISPEKDQSVMARLMAARRKSMQFAPKVGSPLSRAWK